MADLSKLRRRWLVGVAYENMHIPDDLEPRVRARLQAQIRQQPDRPIGGDASCLRRWTYRGAQRTATRLLARHGRLWEVFGPIGKVVD